MTKIDIAIAEPSQIELQQALLLYRGTDSKCLVTVHDVTHTKSGSMLGPGSEFTAKFAKHLLRELSPRKFTAQNKFRLVDSRLIGSGEDVLVWHCPSERRPMCFKSGPELDRISGDTFCHPNLLFVAMKGHFLVFALRNATAKPDLDTQLFLAPYPNIWDSGELCWGGNDPKPGFYVDAIHSYEEAFFSVPFTHVNYRKQFVRHAGGMAGVWNAMRQSHRFPAAWLVPTKRTLRDVLRHSSIY